MCDGMTRDNSRCHSVQVIDACTEREADTMVLKNGWKIHRSRCLCNSKEGHSGFMDATPIDNQQRVGGL